MSVEVLFASRRRPPIANFVWPKSQLPVSFGANNAQTLETPVIPLVTKVPAPESVMKANIDERKMGLDDMVAIAAECIQHPRRHAVWSPQLGKYVCPETDRVPESALHRRSRARPPVSSEFKLVFKAAVGGTVLFVLLCVTLTFAAGRDPPSLETEIVRGLLTLAQLGFGGVVGVLGHKQLYGSDAK
jgi:hypothetical protein